jgi:hypothetical protein
MQLNYLNKPHFDHGAIKNISSILKQLGIKNPLICTDPGLAAMGMSDKIRDLLSNELAPSFYEETPSILLKKQLMKPCLYTRLIIAMALLGLEADQVWTWLNL